MRVRLRGINRVRKRLADGTFKEYFYGWKGGPPLIGEPGSPEFVASYNAAVSRKVAAPPGELLSILIAYQASGEFEALAERTRLDYIRIIKRIEVEFGDFPLSALSERRARSIFLAWRDKLAKKSPRPADYAFSVLARVFSWALGRGLIVANPCEKGGRVYHGSRADKIWTAEDEAAFYRVAPAHLHLALTLALWTGQRQGDLLRLPWSAYDGEFIRLRQSKTGKRVEIKVGETLKAALDATKRRSPIILVDAKGRPWTKDTGDTFRKAWSAACRAADVVGVTFHDLRGTFITRSALAGASEPEIATITGHSLSGLRSTLDSNYLHRDPALGASAIRKLEAGTKNSQLDAQLLSKNGTEKREKS